MFVKKVPVSTTAVTPRRAAVEPELAPVTREPRVVDALIPFAALCLAFFVEMVDNTVMTIALPSMGRDLGASTTQLQWVTGAYSLVFGSLLLTAGSVADRFGRRRTLVAGLAAFGAISALVWLVTSPGQLIAMRGVLGIAASCMAPVTMSLVFRLYDDEKVRMRAISIMVIIGMASMALGPVLAGIVLDQVSWHWLIFGNTPIAACAVAGVLAGVPRDDASDLHDAPLDLPAALATMAVVGLGCYGLTSGTERGWTSMVTLACFVGCVLAAVFFIWREATARHPMVELPLLAHRTVRGSALAQLGSQVAMMAVMFLLILHLQYALGWSPLVAGLGNLPFVITMILSSPVAEQLIGRLGHRITTAIAVAAVVAGVLELAWATPHGYWAMVPGLVVMTLGLRIIMTACAVALIESVPGDRTSLGTALNDVVQEIGSSVGVAVVGTVIAALVGAELPQGAWSAAMSASFFHGERVAYLVVAALVAVVAGYGASTLTDSRNADER